jgi:hypothetical protein
MSLELNPSHEHANESARLCSRGPLLAPCKSATVSMLLYIDVLTVYFVAPLSLFIKGFRGADLCPSHEPLTR